MTYNSISNTPDSWAMAYDYYLDGNLDHTVYKTIDTTDYEYTGDRMDSMGESDLLWDKNGNLTAGLTDLELEWNWDNRLRSAGYTGGDSIACKYSPDGSRLYRQQTVGETTTARKYLVDINGDFPQVLMEIDPNNIENPIQKTYIWANNQLLAQYDGDTPSPIYFYLHDRLGSVRNVLHYDTGTSTVKVDHSYTYNPYGETLIHNAAAGAVTNDFRFAGYIWDDVIEQYCCYKRWYDPRLARFTKRDPVKGKYQEPLTLHPYLYCLNNPINYVDPTGKIAFVIGGSLSFNSNEASGFATSAMGIVKETFGGFFGRALAAATGLMAHNAYTALATNALDSCAAGTAGLGVAFGWSQQSEGLFGGSIGWAAFGPGIGSNYTVSADFACSPNAQNLSDLGGGFTEFGGSFTFPGFLGPFNSLGGAFSKSTSSDIYLITVSPGAGVGKGGEIHAFIGYTWIIDEW